MVQRILDLHIHSKYSRACSKDLDLPNIAKACEVRGIDIVATGDFTHPKWFEHIKESLIEDNEGVYKLKTPPATPSSSSASPYRGGAFGNIKTRFILGTELSCIKKHKDQTRRIHVLVFAPSIEVVEKFNNKLETMGFNLKSDGRPILGLTVKDLLKIMLQVDERMIMIPAHAWTPWFGIFGSKGGYDSLEEAFEELTPNIFAIETGLSSDPLMNWRLSTLDKIALISNSDAHSCAKLGREANVMEFDNEKDITYKNIFDYIKNQDKKHFKYTIEFFPEEGKYHYDGHRDCKFVCSPEETKKLKGICPKCKKALVIGVENRVHELADRTKDETLRLASLAQGWIPYKSLVPLPEIIADTYDCGVSTKRVKEEYNNLIKKLGNEFHILLNSSLEEIAKVSNKDIAEAINRVRTGKIYVRPGYDGEFGIVKVFGDKKNRGGLKQIGLELE
ncbi:MAG: endonuclease Q family protein [Candidatus Magasanikiibacteriota bacterium]